MPPEELRTICAIAGVTLGIACFAAIVLAWPWWTWSTTGLAALLCFYIGLNVEDEDE